MEFSGGYHILLDRIIECNHDHERGNFIRISTEIREEKA